MIVLDTNVISELMRSRPNPAVVAWVAGQPRHTLYTTSINEAELFYGIGAMPEGKRRSGLAAGPKRCSPRSLQGACCPSAALRRAATASLFFIAAGQDGRLRHSTP